MKIKTVFKIHYGSESDKKFSEFQLYDDFSLNDYPIVPLVPDTESSTQLSKEISLGIERPCLLLMGFTEIYIQPGDSIDINYAVLKKTNTEFKDTILFNKGDAAITRQNGDLKYNNVHFINALINTNDNNQVNKIMNIGYLTKEANLAVSKLNLAYISQNRIAHMKMFLAQYYLQAYFNTCINLMASKLPRMAYNIQQNIERRALLLAESVDRLSIGKKTHWYWVGMKLLYEKMLDAKFSKENYLYDSIAATTKKFDDTTKQYFLLLALKRTALVVKPHDDLSSQLATRITYPPFLSYAGKYKKLRLGHFLDEGIKKYRLFDFNIRQTTFEDLFKKATQQFIYLDFCGSWCKPCIEEIKQYAAHKKFDSSDNVKPIWLFFENDTAKWIRVIEKYHLKRENCFLALNNEALQKSFATQFSWAGEFPHHFVFNRKGVIVNNDAPPLSVLDVKMLEK